MPRVPQELAAECSGHQISTFDLSPLAFSSAASHEADSGVVEGACC